MRNPSDQLVTNSLARAGVISASLPQRSSTTSGLDAIPAKPLAIGRPVIGYRITTLFRSCLESGTYPDAFKEAAVSSVPKPGRCDHSLNKAYRLVSLILFKHRIGAVPIPPSCLQCDGAPNTLDRTNVVQYHLTMALACDVEEAWNRGHVAGLFDDGC